MKLKISLAWLMVACMVSVNLAAQDEESQGSLDGGSLKSQYDYLIDESNDYQEYKVIRKTWVAKFERNLNDSIEAQRAAEKDVAGTLKNQKSQINKLQQQLTATRDSLNTSLEEKRSMAWLGMPMEKKSYRVLMWSIIGALTLTVVILIVMFRNSHAVTRDAKEKFTGLDEEFQQYKKRSLEREQKLRRELQDEINKQKVQR